MISEFLTKRAMQMSADFQVKDKVFLRVSPTKRAMTIGKKGKLSPRFVASYEIREHIGEVAYYL